MEESRGEHRRKWAKKYGISPKSSMERRKDFHDYHSRRIYMITIVTEERRPLLGTLQDKDESHPEPWIKYSSIGDNVLYYWKKIPIKYPEIRLIAIQLMPDHMHGILFVTKEIGIHLGNVIAWFKKECNAVSLKQSGVSLWKSGYNDIILSSKGQLQKMVHYLHDNPRRLWVKRHKKEYFTIKKNITVGDWNVATVGNQFLLDYPLKAVVQCSRSITTDEDIDKEVNKYMSLAQNGAVLVSASISKAEKAVMRAAYEAKCKVIVILENGFSPMWKPGGKQFEACAEGRLLLVAPWNHHNQEKTITREQCLQLNKLAQAIAETT